ncbi:uncharacterized protein LOC9663123 [Selaginella moellendorffii]|uniref:uncharacterized protein LOC9663123 n=1 Tax=Selaginella moellendorffii TaxID=88036 RepID=UPI000D1C4453|nr:uncharacterized protein LOC9663123 [Selaginella moellendorffii]|eukprot:XP_024530953.1 uncharacterized protein LOC9663123 [Selaginella moellendorffii]
MALLKAQSLSSLGLSRSDATRFSAGGSSTQRLCVIPLKNTRDPQGLRVQCMVLETPSKVEKLTLLHELYSKHQQSPWYDNLRRPVTDLQPLIDSGVRGVTSNPTIFQKAISSSDAYDPQFRQLVQGGSKVEDAYWQMVIKDIQDACDLFLGVFSSSKGEDGYVSVEVSPLLAHETDETLNAAKWLHKEVNRPNVYVKIPATAECVPSIRSAISLGISVNVTLIFSLPRYEAVIDAYLDGLEAREGDLSGVSSVASFFVSRVDTLVDKRLNEIGTDEALQLRGKAAVAQAALAFQLYEKKFSGPRWEALKKRGARKQRLLWASTSVKNPAYSDTLYIDTLIGPDTVNTMPGNALEAFVDHGTLARTLDSDVDGAQKIYDKIEALGIRWDDVGSLLEIEGVDSFKKSFEDLLVSLKLKAELLVK